MFAASKTAGAVSAAPPASSDPQFNYVSLLLNDTGTNGQQNNTFLDSSSNNFTITRNGTPTQGSVTPYWPNGQWSNYFSGTVGNYISVPDNAAFQLGSGDFTIEGWVNLSSLTASSYLMGKGDRATVAGSAFSLPFTGYTMDFYAGSSVFSLSTFTPTLNVWFHIAIVRNGTTITRYINGVSNASVTIGTASINTGGSNEVRIGGYVNSTGFLGINGYLSNLRIVKGTALYTSNFTPSTTPLTAVSGTSLLTCQSNRFKDNSSNNFAITVTGTPTVQAFEPFEPASSYATSVGGSGYFNGSTQYLTIPTNAAFQLTNTTAFTLEAWVYRSTTALRKAIFSAYNPASAYQGYGLGIGGDAVTNQLQFWDGSSWRSFGAIPVNAWTHVAVCSDGTNCRVFINGVQGGSTFTPGSNINYTAGSVFIGAQPTPQDYWEGYISNLRLVKGTAVYTSNFTPPTSPVTAITGTSLLLNCTNAGIYDAATLNDLVTVGNAQVSTAQAKFGSSSMAFDGTGDYLTFPAGQNTAFGTGDFTVEAWVNFSNSSASPFYFIDTRNSGQTANWAFYRATANSLNWFTGATEFFGPSLTTTNTWTHVAISRSGTSLRMFVNGVLTNTFTDSRNYSIAPTISYIGCRYSAAEFLNGYIEDLRITKGYARYTANFTPPTAPFPTR